MQLHPLSLPSRRAAPRRCRRLAVQLLLVCGFLAAAAPPAGAQDTSRVSVTRLSDTGGFSEGGSGDDAATTFRISLNFHPPSGPSVTVSYTVGGTTTTSDYSVSSSTSSPSVSVSSNSITFSRDLFNPGAQTADLVFTAVDDNENEGNETLTVTLDEPSISTGAAVNRTPASATITDNDTTHISLGPITSAARPEGTAFQVPFLFEGGTPLSNVNVTYEISPSMGSTISMADFGTLPGSGNTPLTRTLSFVPGAPMSGSGQIQIPSLGSTTRRGQVIVNFPTVDDTLTEADEPFEIRLGTVAVTSGGQGVFSAGPPSASSPGQRSIALSIRDNDAVVVNIADATVTEGGTLSFTVTAARAGGGAVTTTAAITGMYTVTAGTADAATDYTPRTPLTFAIDPSTTPPHTTTITVQTTPDNLAEGDETLTVELLSGSVTGGGSARGVSVGSGRATGTIVDDDPIRISLGVASPAADAEEGMPFTIPFVFAGGTPQNGFDVTYRIAPSMGSAIDAADFGTLLGSAPDSTPLTRTLSFVLGTPSAGQFQLPSTFPGTVSVPFPTENDTLAEANEPFQITLTGAGPASGGQGTTMLASPNPSVDLTINDNDQLTVRIADAAPVTEGAQLSFTVTTSGATPSAPITGSYTLTGTADGATDYTPPSPLTFQIDARMATKTITVQTTDDTRVEAAMETVIITLSNVMGGGGALDVSVGEGQATGIINDNEAVTLTIADAEVREGGMLSFAVTASGAITSTQITGSYELTNVTTDGGDFTTPADRTFAIAVGTTPTTTTIEVQTTDDSLVEADMETLTIGLRDIRRDGSTQGVRVADAQATGTIREDDIRLFLRRTMQTGTVSEGARVFFEVRREGAITPAVTVEYSVTMGGVTSTPPLSVTIPANEPSVPLPPVTIDDDNLLESGETVEVSLVGVTGPTGPPPFPVEARDPDPARTTAEIVIANSDNNAILLERLTGPGGTVIAGGGTVAEAEADGTARYRVSLTGDPLTQPVDVTWRVESTGGAAVAEAADFSGGVLPTSGSMPLSFRQLNTPQEFTIKTVQDGELEGDEVFSVTVRTPNIPPMSAELTTTLLDDEVGVGVSAAQSSVFEGRTARFTFRRTGPLGVDATVQYTVAGVDPTDYRDPQPTPGTLQIPAGQANATLDLEILDEGDGIEEANEMLQLRIDAVDLSGGSGEGVLIPEAQTAVVMIPRLQITATLTGGDEVVEVPEGAVARFDVELSLVPAGSTFADVVLGYDLGLAPGDSAIRGDDYDAPAGAADGMGELRLSAGQLTGVIEVPVRRDGLLETEEIFSLALVEERTRTEGGSIRLGAVQERQVRILDNADQEARREQRTRGMLAATNRAAANMATDVITARFQRGTTRPQASANASADRLRPQRSRQSEPRSARAASEAERKRRPSSPTAFKAERTEVGARSAARPGHKARARSEGGARAKSCSGRERTAETSARCASTRSSNARLEPAAEHNHPQSQGADEASEGATALATDALSTALQLTGLSTGIASGEPAAPNPESAALLAGIDVPVRPFERDPYAVGSSGAPSTDASATDRGDALDPRLPSLAELLKGGTQFELSGEQAGWGGFGEGLAVWGSGVFTSLEGDPELDGRRFDYDGQSYGVFLGADKRLALSGAGSELLAGAALGWTRGDLDYLDPVGSQLEGRFESELVSLHPYASLRLSPRTQLWLIAGYGWGDVDIEERDGPDRGDVLRRVETDATMWMVSAGAEGSVPLGLGDATELSLRLHGTRTGGQLDGASFDDDARLPGTRARTWRVAGELEGSHRLVFAEGGHFRPFVTARVRGDAGDDLGDDWEFSIDVGGGADLTWPERGLLLGLEGTAQLNEGAGHREHRVAVQMSYDLAGDGRGLTVAVESALEGSAQLGARRRGVAGLDPEGLGGSSLSALVPGARALGADPETDLGIGSLRHSLQGEIGYGLSARPWRSPGLLTPYVRFDLARGGHGYATGLRFESLAGARFGIEAGMDLERRRRIGASSPRAPDYQFLLTGELKF